MARKWSKTEMEEVIEKFENYPEDKSHFFFEENITRSAFYGLKRRYRLKYLEENASVEKVPRSSANVVSILPTDNRLTLELGRDLKIKGNTDEISRLILKLNLLK